MSNVRQAPQSRSTWKSDASAHYDAFMGRLSPKHRDAMTRHDEPVDGTPYDSILWKRIAGGLSKLAPHTPELDGRKSIKFYIPDGKYRQQVFALEDSADGSLVLYLPDVAQRAMDRKILPKNAAANTTPRPADFHFDIITADTPDITVCKAMVSWGKRAIRTRLAADATEEQLATVERLCELAAETWATPAAASTAP